MMAEAPRRIAEKAAGDDRLQIGDITIHRLANIDRIPWPIEAMFNDADGPVFARLVKSGGGFRAVAHDSAERSTRIQTRRIPDRK